MISDILLPLFFIYYYIIASSFKDLANCSLQRFISKSLIFKHIMIIVSIYVFTYILFWYNLSAFSSLKNKLINDAKTIRSESIESFQNIQIEREATRNYLKRTTKITLIIYMIFLLSTKNSGIFITIFIIIVFAIMLFLFFISFYYGDIYQNYKRYLFINKDIKNNIIKQFKYPKNEINQYVLMHNLNFILIITMNLCLIIGCFKYGIKQYNDHKDNWSWIKFWFGTNKTCIDL